MFDVTTIAARGNAQQNNGAGSTYPVATGSAYYIFFIAGADSGVYYRKSTDGVTWGEPVQIAAITCTQMAVWYDGWSGLSGGLVHITYTDSGADDTYYRNLDTNSDTLATQRVVFAGASTATTNGAISITRARGGNVYVKVMIDNGAEGGFFKLPNADVAASNDAWDQTLNDSETVVGAGGDHWHLLPGWAPDNQDIMMAYYDHSALAVTICYYDDSADSWASIAETAVTSVGSTGYAAGFYPHFAVAVDTVNSQNLVLTWSDPPDTASADLRLWKVTESGVTEAGSPDAVVSNGTDDQGLCAIAIDTDTQDWYAFYAGAADGSQTWPTAVQIYYKKSTDDGDNWGSETPLLPTNALVSTTFLAACPRFATHPLVINTALSSSTVLLLATTDTPVSASAGVIGG